jgi:hypothetical protein
MRSGGSKVWHARAAILSWTTVLLGLLANVATSTVKIASHWWTVAVWIALALVALVVTRLERTDPGSTRLSSSIETAGVQNVSVSGDRSVALGGDNHGDIVICERGVDR